jgi:dTDP-4-amino-4,6-dideoxygalactose transaminase
VTHRAFFEPPLRVVIPPRPRNPGLLGKRLMEILDSGNYKFGNRWTAELADRLAERLGIGPDRELILTVSGTAALRLAAITVRGCYPLRGRPGTAVLPSFTFAATGEFLRQLGYELIFCDVDAATWNMSQEALARILREQPVDLVVSVDALGNPAAHTALARLCHDAGVPLLSDSAAALGAGHPSGPIGTQADAHTFSMSMAKVVSAAGAGGFAVLPAGSRELLERDANWIRSSQMTETNAVVALDQFEDLDGMLARRAAVAGIYAGAAGCTPGLALQATLPGDTHSWVHAVLRCGPPYDRDEIAAGLAGFGIETKPYYAPPLHTFLPHKGEAGSLPETSALAGEVLALPVSSEMTRRDGELVAEALAMLIDDWVG